MFWQTRGFEFQKTLFTKLLTSGLGQAYLFQGMAMIGKRSFALDLAAMIINQQRDRLATAPDFKELKPDISESGRVITIEAVRTAQAFLALAAPVGSRRVLIIDDAHLLNQEAQNALLKTLEEPNSSALIFLITEAPDKILNTIHSRVQLINFAPHSREIMRQALSDRELTTEQLDFIINFTGGRLGLAFDLLDQNKLPALKMAVKELSDLKRAGLYDRMEAATQLLGEDNARQLPEKVLWWLLYLMNRPDRQRYAMVLAGLQKLHSDLLQPALNKRLALESFLINL